MNHKPSINAALAEIYIIGLVTFMSTLQKLVPGPDTLLAPIFALSLFVLSAAVMFYLFCMTPIQLFIAGDQAHAVNFFLRTLVAFAVLTLIVFICLWLVGYLVV